MTPPPYHHSLFMRMDSVPYHAITNNKPFVQATRGTYSYVIDKDGNILTETDRPNSIERISTKVETSKKRTLFSSIGGFIVLALVHCLGYLAYARRRELSIKLDWHRRISTKEQTEAELIYVAVRHSTTPSRIGPDVHVGL